MNEHQGKASTRAKQKYNEKAYDRLYPYVKAGKKERYQAAAEKAGCSLNELIEKAMDEMSDSILG